MKQDCSPSGASNDQPGKRTHAGTTKAEVSSGNSMSQGDREPPGTPPEAHNNGLGTSRTTEEHNSEDNTDHSGKKSTKDELREKTADSDLELASGDCLTCSDTEEVAIRTAQNRFWERVQASCSIVRGCLKPK